MKPKPFKIFYSPKTHKGFTLIELIIVLAVIGILASIGSMFYADVTRRAADAQAFSEGKNLLIAASNAFLDDEDIEFTTGGDVTGPVGDTDNGGGARTAIFTISSRVRARLTGESITGSGGGYLTFEIWSLDGTISGTASGKKEYYFEVDEDANIITIPSSVAS